MLIVPILGVSSQLMAVFEVPVTEAVSLTDWPTVRELDPAPREMLTGVTGCNIKTVAVALIKVFQRLVAVIVTCVSPETDAGAV